jgi:restriction endonuclease S subunit
LVEWTEALKHIQPNGATTVEDVYKKLKNGKPENILPYLLKLNPTSALEADIAREYVSNLDNDLILKHKELNVIKEILKSGAKYPMVKLKDYLILNENKIKPNKTPDVNYKVLGVSNEVGIFLNEKLQAEETNQSYFVVAKNEFCYNPYRINVGSIGLNTNDFDNQIISGAYIVFACKEDELMPKYLDTLFKSKGFLNYVNDKANGGVRMNFKFEDMEAWEIPLPPIEEQTAIVARIEKQKAIVEGADLVLKNWDYEFPNTDDAKKVTVNDVTIVVTKGTTPTSIGGAYLNEGVTFVRSENVLKNRLDITKTLFIDNEFHKKELSRSRIFKNDILLNIVGASIGRAAIFDLDIEANCNQAVSIIRPTTENIIPEYLLYFLNNKSSQDEMFGKKYGGARDNLNLEQVRDLAIPLPDIKTQIDFVERLDIQMKVITGLELIQDTAQRKINQILADVWGVEFSEPIKMEVADEQEN